MLRRLTIAVAILAMLGTAANAQNRDRVLQVMTRNMDTGSDFGFVLGATDQLGVLLGIRATYQEILASDIPERADGIAGEIQTIHPDLVALQEITTLSTGPYGGPATTVVANQLQSLMAALRRRGLHYATIALQANADVELPAFDQSFNPFDVRLTDFDAVLARTDLPVSEFKLANIQQQHFNAALVFPILGQAIRFPRGWIALDAKLRGKTYRVVTTHLETLNLEVQAAQALELVSGPGSSGLPLVLAGDLNSDANNPSQAQSPAYHTLVNAGFLDVWEILHPGDAGNTWPLHGEDPQTQASTPNQRIDLVLTRGDGITAREISLVGTTPPGSMQLWPSDHAGVVGSFTLLPKQ